MAFPYVAGCVDDAFAREGLRVPAATLRRATRDAYCMASSAVLHLLVHQFHAWRRSRGSLRSDSDERYRAYLLEVGQEGGLARLFASFPAARQSFDLVLQRRAKFLAGMIRHLWDDRALLVRAWGVDDVLEIEWASLPADPHRGQRTPVVIGRGAGQVVYKPRSLAPERLLYRLFQDMDERSPVSRFMVPEIRTLPSHGYMSYVQPRLIKRQSEAEAYLIRVGALLAVAWTVRLTDLHAENVIAHGPWPVVVDAETLLQPSLATSADRSLGGDATTFSVLDTHLLPRLLSNEHRVWDISVLGATPSAGTGYPALELTDVNTDAMTLRWGEARTAEFQVPGASLLDHRGAGDLLQDGFRSVIEDLTAAPHLVRAIRADAVRVKLERRVIVRATGVYRRLLERAASADFAASPASREEQLRLPVRSPSGEAREWAEELAQSETAQLSAGDVPYFTSVPGSGILSDGESMRLPIVLHDPALDASLDAPRRVEQEAAVVAASLAARRPQLTARVPKHPTAVPSHSAGEVALMLVDGMVQSGALPADPAGPWLTCEGEGPASVARMGSDLYRGAAGTACLIAAVAAVDRERSPWASALLSRFADRLREGRYDDLRGKLGALDGLASLVLAVRFIERLRPGSIPPLVQSRVRAELAQLMDERLTQSHVTLDLAGGLAGAVLALADSEAHRSVVAAAVGRLLSEQRPTGGWPSLDGLELCGAAHGASGVVMALAAAQRRNPGLSTKTAVMKALDFERAHYSRDALNWSDLRAGAQPGEALAAWCHGAVGIGQARAFLPRSNGTSATELDDAIDSVLAHPALNDRLCCGSAGQLDWLSSRRGRSSAVNLQRRLQALGQRAAQPALLRLDPPTDGEGTLSWFRPGLFRGLSGVAYVLLRATYRRLPPVLEVVAPFAPRMR